MSQETAASGTTTPVPQQRTVEPDAAADHGEAKKPVRSVPFDRLLSVAALTPAQASFVALRLLDAAVPEGPGDEDPRAAAIGAVTLAPSGEVEVRRASADEGRPVVELLRQVLQNARRLPSHPKPQQLSLLRSLEEAARDPVLDPAGRARDLEKALTDTLGPGAGPRLAAQLAALVDAFAHVAPGGPGSRGTLEAPPALSATTAPVKVPAATSAAPVSSQSAPQRAARAAPAPRPPRRQRRPRHHNRPLLRRRTRGRVALVALVLAAALAVSGYVVLRGQGVEFVGSLGRGDQPAAPDASPSAPPSKQTAKQPKRDRKPPVSTIAARRAGPIRSVSVQKAGSCKPGALCPVRVTVRFQPASTARAVTWKVGAARLCKPGITWSAPTTVTAQPGWGTVYADSSVRVPQGRSLALVALTSAPARAQSRPLPVTGSALRC